MSKSGPDSKPITPAFNNQPRRQYTIEQLYEIRKACHGLPCPFDIPLAVKVPADPQPTPVSKPKC